MAAVPPDVDIYNTPALPPPEGVTPNFNRTLTDTQWTTIIVFAVTYSLATFSLILRYITNALIVRSWEVDLMLVTVAWGTALAYFVCVALCMNYGWGAHAWNVTIAETAGYFKYLVPITITYVWSPNLSKLSILTVLHRISPAKGYRWCIYAIGTMLIAYTLTFTGLLTGPCNPLDAGASVCLNNIAIAQVVLNIFSDVAIMVLPLPTLHSLQIPFRQKVVVGGLLCLGSAVLVASIVRAPYIRILATNPDFTAKQAEAGVWSLVELNVGVLCNNLMRLRPFINRYFPKLLTVLGLSGSRSKRQGGSSARQTDDWHRGPSNSYPLRSRDGDFQSKYKQDMGSEHSASASHGGRPRENGSTDSILT